MFSVEELKESTIGAETIFYKFHVIFIKMTRFCKINNLGHVLSSYIFYYEQLLLLVLTDVTLKRCDFHSSAPFKLTLK